MKTVVLIGDSIRTGYQDTVRSEMTGVAEVWGPEQNGGASRNILAHLDECAISCQPDIIHINWALLRQRRCMEGNGGAVSSGNNRQTRRRRSVALQETVSRRSFKTGSER